jgi:hypothetical protein
MTQQARDHKPSLLSFKGGRMNGSIDNWTWEYEELGHRNHAVLVIYDTNDDEGRSFSMKLPKGLTQPEVLELVKRHIGKE